MHFKSSVRRRRGLTLIEVVAATALLGTILVAALVSFSSHRAQVLRASSKHQAIQAMDVLMVDLFSKTDWTKYPTSGGCPDAPALMWRSSIHTAGAVGDDWPVRRIRFEIVSTDNRREVLASVELLAIDPSNFGEDEPLTEPLP
jgi:prepilin-type N-terminal cleavage/methylation domain-containing protein